MTEHVVLARWRLEPGDEFRTGKYSRRHEWEFDSGQVINASPSVSVVRPPFSDPSCIDPEEAFVASISSCHLLTFLYLASKRGYTVNAYSARAVGRLEKNDKGVPWVSRVELYPQIDFADDVPSAEILNQLHHDAHDQCFIANSVKTDIVVCTETSA